MHELIKSKWFWGFAAVIIFVGIYFASAGEGVSVKTAKAEDASISAYIEERARTTLPMVYHISMPYDGRIEPITIEAGTAVAKGQVVARLDLADMNTELTKSIVRIEALKGEITVNKYNAIENTAFKESAKLIKSMSAAVDASSKKVEASKAKNKYAAWILNANERMFKSKAMSEKDVNRSRMEAAEAAMGFEADKLNLNSMQAMLDIIKLMPVYITQFLKRKELNGDVLTDLLKATEADKEKVERDIKMGTFQSPVDGIILRRFVKNKKVLPSGAPLLDIGDLSELRVTADILSQDAVRIKPGNPVDIYGAAIGDKPIYGTVLKVNPKGFMKLSSLGVEEQRVAVEITFNKNELEKLKKSGRTIALDYRVNVRVHTSSADNALVIPCTAIFRGEDGSWQAFLADGSKAKLVHLKIGISNDRQVQVLEGLKPGDQVLIAPPTSIVSGTSIKY